MAFLCSLAQAQTTTTFTGTIKDLTGTVVTSGNVTFTLQPGADTTISGSARFTPQTITCGINGSGLVKANDLTNPCVATNNTALQPAGTSWKIQICPAFACTSSLVTYALGGSVDITTLVPTPAQMPAYSLVDVFQNQTIAGNKTLSGSTIFTGSATFSNSAAFNSTFTFTGNGTHIGSETFSNINGDIVVDGTQYALTPTGIQNALNQASSNGGGRVILPPTKTSPIAMGSTNLSVAPGVCLEGAGSGATNLAWTGAPAGGGIGLTSPVRSCVKGLKLTFSSGLNAAGIRITGTDAAPAWKNVIDDVHCDFGTLGAVGSVCIFASGSGPSNTDIVLNHFTRIYVDTADQAVVCTACEGNYWDITGQNLGAQAGSVMATWSGTNNNEHIDARMETGSGNFINEKCLSISGNDNHVVLTCDGGLAGVTSVNDVGGYNEFDIVAVGSPTLGTVQATSHVRFVSASIPQSQAQLPAHQTVIGGGSGVPPTFSPGLTGALVDIGATLGGGSAKGYALVGACRGNSDSVGDRCYAVWGKATAASQLTTEVGGHFETADAGGTQIELIGGGTTYFKVASTLTTIGASGTGLAKVATYSASITPGAVTASQCAEQTFGTFTGLSTSDKISVTPPASLGTHVWIGWARPSASNTLAIGFCGDATSGTPASGSYSVLAVQ